VVTCTFPSFEVGVDLVESVVVGGDFDGFAWVVGGSAKGFQVLLVDACMD
jgi:hypothetical protein